jgi:methyltransferase
VLLALAVGAERVAELRLSARHTRWARARGGVEFGRGHHPAMVAVHTGLLVGMVAEAALTRRPVRPRTARAALVAAVGAQAVRWWCVGSLGPRWNTRVVVVPGLPPVTRGPYRRLRHPNYAAVAVEGVALPLVPGAWRTALAFTVANAAVLAVRLRTENAALAWAAGAASNPRNPDGALANAPPRR